MATFDDMAAGMMGVIGTTAMVGVGAAAGVAAVKMMERAGEQMTRTPTRTRKRARKNKY